MNGEMSCSLSELLAMDEYDFESAAVCAITGKPAGSVEYSDFVAIPDSVKDGMVNINISFSIKEE